MSEEVQRNNLERDVSPNNPLNLGLNDGTYAPRASIEAIRAFSTRTSLRNYTTPNNDPLREAIASADGVGPEHVYLRNGSGPILRQVIPHLVKTSIKSSARRVVRQLVNKSGFPIITPRHTYGKLPRKAADLGLTVKFLSLEPPHFRLDVDELERVLAKQDGLVYITTPNNPTGNVLITRAQLEPLLGKYPRSHFIIDEAYVHYVDPQEHPYCSDLVPHYDNLVVSRTFSFAYGLAGLRVGYLLAPSPLVETLESQVTDYRIGMLAEQACIAGLRDASHLPFVREKTRETTRKIIDAVNGMDGVEAYDTTVNFVFCRLTDGRRAETVADALAHRGILIKTFSPVAQQTYDEYFRLTVGVGAENQFLLDHVADVLGNAQSSP
ncbi:MAG: histidinol-phosphate aminotransferase family protein [Deltaproteobacteria bacterium]|nr:histidinol-phosphate aminotransferase family protein [Deltaproteobacteria bacterium]